MDEGADLGNSARGALERVDCLVFTMATGLNTVCDLVEVLLRKLQARASLLCYDVCS